MNTVFQFKLMDIKWQIHKQEDAYLFQSFIYRHGRWLRLSEEKFGNYDSARQEMHRSWIKTLGLSETALHTYLAQIRGKPLLNLQRQLNGKGSVFVHQRRLKTDPVYRQQVKRKRRREARQNSAP